MEGWRQDIYVKYGYVLTTIIGQDWVKLSKEYGFQLAVLPIESRITSCDRFFWIIQDDQD